MEAPEPLAELVALIAAAVAPDASILDVGCGDGELVGVLRARGYDAVGIDRKGPAGPHCTQVALEEFAPGRAFDAVVARLSLHHTENVGASFHRLRDLTAADGRLFVEEFGWESVDRRAIAWAREHLVPPGPDPHAIDYASGSVDDAFARWVERYGELHTGAALIAAAGAYFRCERLARIPFLSRLSDLPHELTAEREQIDAGAIGALGFRFVGTPLAAQP